MFWFLWSAASQSVARWEESFHAAPMFKDSMTFVTLHLSTFNNHTSKAAFLFSFSSAVLDIICRLNCNSINACHWKTGRLTSMYQYFTIYKL